MIFRKHRNVQINWINTFDNGFKFKEEDKLNGWMWNSLKFLSVPIDSLNTRNNRGKTIIL